MLTREEIIERKLCVGCDTSICHNNYDLCPYQYKPDAHLCLICKDIDNEIVDGKLKCYYTCRHRKDKKEYSGGLDMWLLKDQNDKIDKNNLINCNNE